MATPRTNMPVEQDYSELAVPEAPKVDYTEQEILAKLADTSGWAAVTRKVQEKIDFHTQYLPGNLDLSKVDSTNWIEFQIAQKTAFNLIMGYREILSEVESAQNAIKARQ